MADTEAQDRIWPYPGRNLPGPGELHLRAHRAGAERTRMADLAALVRRLDGCDR